MTFRWRLYYEDGGMFSDTDGPPHGSPPWGVVAVSQPEACVGQKELLGNGDYYLYRSDLEMWHEVGERGLDVHLARYGHLITCVRPGFWMPERDEWLEIVERMRVEAASA